MFNEGRIRSPQYEFPSFAQAEHEKFIKFYDADIKNSGKCTMDFKKRQTVVTTTYAEGGL